MPKRILKGRVVKQSGDKTISVLVERRTAHPLYGKIITTSKKYLVHDEQAKAVVGDNVRIEESAPISKRKSWVLLND